ncbi:hypothetical protein ABI59_11085 [Acidobacteria bacterium Mor1]|nr:hypothetical protein ABI59_11085 [Acidobacteria bacterium Mor1]
MGGQQQVGVDQQEAVVAAKRHRRGIADRRVAAQQEQSIPQLQTVQGRLHASVLGGHGDGQSDQQQQQHDPVDLQTHGVPLDGGRHGGRLRYPSAPEA